jgi:hypothetical protein
MTSRAEDVPQPHIAKLLYLVFVLDHRFGPLDANPRPFAYAITVFDAIASGRVMAIPHPRRERPTSIVGDSCAAREASAEICVPPTTSRKPAVASDHRGS